MYTFVVILHVIVSIALILIILLQTGKGADIGAVFGGGGSNTLFGASGPASFLSRLTAGAAVVFMLTSLFLAYFAGSRPLGTIMRGAQTPTMPGGMPVGSAAMPPGPGGMPAPAPTGAPAAAPAAPAK